MRSLFVLVTAAVLLSGCEKVIKLELNNVESTLVVEGNISNQPGPYYVKLTKSVRFDAASQYPGVANATVIIADNTGITDTLTQTGSGLYKTNSTQGIEGRTYNLSVVAEGKTYTAISTMPVRVPLDSLRQNVLTFGGEKRYSVTPVYTDPPAPGNNYRFVMYVNDVLDKSQFAFNDNIENGAVNQRPLRSDDIELKKGDIVRIEMQCIDATAYTYYYTLSQSGGGGFGGGTTPSNPSNKISGGALGLFSAHTSQIQSIVIP